MIIAVFPSEPSDSLEEGLGFVSSQIERPKALDPADPALQEVDLAVVELGDQPMRRLREAGRVAEDLGVPVFLVIEPDQIALVDSTTPFIDFQIAPVEPAEFRLRIHRLATENSDDEVINFKDLVLNTLTYQAELGGVPMDLTYMEYELLRFLVTNPTRVWSREQLLSRVWGYEYYGGARTVDVHVRRLRSKLGEERSSWITTVRSVGYRFG
ncbi:MAG: response regulator transcription factor [Acidimicrobiia bacterium]